MTVTVSSDGSICSAMKDATNCHAIEPEENQAKKNKLEKSWPQFAQNRPAKSLSIKNADMSLWCSLVYDADMSL